MSITENKMCGWNINQGSCEFDIVTMPEDIFSRVDAFAAIPETSRAWLFEVKSTTQTRLGRTEYDGVIDTIRV